MNFPLLLGCSFVSIAIDRKRYVNESLHGSFSVSLCHCFSAEGVLSSNTIGPARRRLDVRSGPLLFDRLRANGRRTSPCRLDRKKSVKEDRGDTSNAEPEFRDRTRSLVCGMSRIPVLQVFTKEYRKKMRSVDWAMFFLNDLPGLIGLVVLVGILLYYFFGA